MTGSSDPGDKYHERPTIADGRAGAGGSKRIAREQRVDTLRRITDLFLVAPAQLNAEQIGVFDDVLAHLVARVESKARAELANRLAPVEQAPVESSSGWAMTTISRWPGQS